MNHLWTRVHKISWTRTKSRGINPGMTKRTGTQARRWYVQLVRTTMSDPLVQAGSEWLLVASVGMVDRRVGLVGPEQVTRCSRADSTPFERLLASGRPWET